MAQANNKIQIKRSTANAVVTGLANGELAFTQASNTLFIGLPDGSGVVPIGGARYPGTLTANQALVANSTSGIDKIIVANAALSKIYTTANGYGSAGYILAVDGTGNVYWTSPSSVAVTPAGSNTYVQFNDSGSLGATLGFVFDKAANTLSVANTISTVELQVSGKLKANGSYGTASQILSSNSTGGVYWVAATPATNADAQYAWTNTQSFSNTITFNGAILANTANATTFTAGVYGSATAGFVANSILIAVGNSSVNVTINSTSFSGTANNALYLGGTIASSYALKTYADTAAATAYTNATSYADTKAGAAYTNATSYADTKAGAAYTNATSYADTKAGAAYSNAMSDTLTRNGSYTGNNTFAGTNTVVSSNTLINGTLTVNNAVSVNGHIIPASNVTVDLGNTTNSFRSLYVGGTTVFLGTMSLKDSSGTLQVNAAVGGAASGLAVANLTLSTNTFTVGTAAYYVANGNFGIGNSSPADKLSVNGTTTLSGNVTITGANIVASSSQLNVRDAVVSGNLTVQGTLTTLDTTNLQVKDNSIKLADQQASTVTFLDALDIAVYGTFGNTSNTQFAGFYRDSGASTGLNSVFKLFTSNTEPSAIVDNTAPGYVLGTLNSYVTTGAFVANSTVVNITATGAVSSALIANSVTTGAFVANSTVVNITATGAVSSALIANSLTLSTALAASYGGTGQSSYAAGDLLYASGSTALSKLNIGSPGTVLQVSDGNLPAYFSLDGGQF
jgi:hypothetical protein